MFNWPAYGFWLIGYYPLVYIPLTLLEYIIKAFITIGIGLPQYLLFGIPINGKFSDIQLPLMFLRIAIISIFVFAILFACSAIRVQFQKEDQESPIKIALKNSIYGTIWLIGVPVALFVFHTIINILTSLILGGNNISLSKTIFLSLRNPEWKNIPVSLWEDIANKGYSIDYPTYTKFEWGQGILLNLVGGLISIATLIPFGLAILTLVQKIFQQFFLFIISPFIAASSVSDDGRRMKQFQEMYAAKSFVVLGMIIALQLYAVYITRAQRLLVEIQDEVWWYKILIFFAILVGGGVATMGITNEIAAFVGESASARETMGETKNLFGSVKSLSGAAVAIGATGIAAGAAAGKFGLKRTKTGTRLLENRSEKQLLKNMLKSGDISLGNYNRSKAALINDIRTSKLERKDERAKNKARKKDFVADKKQAEIKADINKQNNRVDDQIAETTEKTNERVALLNQRIDEAKSARDTSRVARLSSELDSIKAKSDKKLAKLNTKKEQITNYASENDIELNKDKVDVESWLKDEHIGHKASDFMASDKRLAKRSNRQLRWMKLRDMYANQLIKDEDKQAHIKKAQKQAKRTEVLQSELDKKTKTRQNEDGSFDPIHTKGTNKNKLKYKRKKQDLLSKYSDSNDSLSSK
ncbi:Mbov_0396 family ICE element transmembrane protein [Mycoplasma mycoides]|uniref:Mbov_0396 family ICE element transmembrane protein n=1 Tax=Mycoplasma mycoides TaxID=2102 RepID=UPI0002F4394D|nr:hypothetical protein [Mycoplasma mycoides]SRX59013.1 hypothetical protein MMC68K_00573 [Mycoplasma mycoides subsp. capri]SRX63282.1 hypothetical protein MMC68N_00562 [Mycoplasma mycoides subsp. capri]SRX64343.1 hypothetical protein MMC68H_00611 [Mycoplasma mycoides subsp. capri]SRX66601.1 hypothetical protein MMC68F_00591 [Mycoplasma mycoides subsp. capri]SRX67943.1 hypothetical protein MMC68P_00567 [Mycoplasma mycoides subsp. capri]